MGFQEGIYTQGQNVAFEKYASYAGKHFPGLLSHMEQPLEGFRKKLYPRVFRWYCDQNRKLTSAIEQAYLLAAKPDDFLDELAAAFAMEASEQVFFYSKKRLQEERLLNLNLAVMAYISPMLLEAGGKSGERLALKVHKEWKAMFPKTNLTCSTFESINQSFKGRLCYITTAVCVCLGQSGDCYELSLLRAYRDKYLVKQPGGAALIKEYYDIAPTIVKRIGRQANPIKIYKNVWETYLHPCIHFIERGEPEACREIYVTMLNDLKRQYFIH